MSKSDRLYFIASRVNLRRATLTRAVDCPYITPAQLTRIMRRLSRA